MSTLSGCGASASKAFRDRRKYVHVEPPRKIELDSIGNTNPIRKMLDFPGTPGCGRAFPGAHAPESPYLHSRLHDRRVRVTYLRQTVSAEKGFSGACAAGRCARSLQGWIYGGPEKPFSAITVV
jgi:hypothetical protein